MSKENISFVDVLKEKIMSGFYPSILVVDKYPWITPTIIGRLAEELGIDLFVILTSQHVVQSVEQSLQHIKEDVEDLGAIILPDYVFGQSLVKDNVFDTAFTLNNVFSKISDQVEKIVVDLSGSDGAIAATTVYSVKKILGDKAVFTVVDTIPLYGIPAYPGSPRWLHKVYVYGDAGIRKKGSIVDDYPKNIEWRGSRGIYIAISKLFNTLTRCGFIETYHNSRRYMPGENSKLEAWIETIGALGEKRRLLMIEELKGPDQNTSNMLYNAWKQISELLDMAIGDKDKQSIDRLVMQIQRYVGAADLIIKESASSSPQWFDHEGEKLHRIILRSTGERNKLAVVPDTNLFYQGLHMVLLKASIRQGSPWSTLRNISVYIPRCAETEINGKVAETNPDAGGLQRVSYIMALLANRALLETKYYYDAKTLSATAQPCEASMAVEAPNLPEHRILLITADHKAFTAWQTLNVCRGKVACAYIGHSDKPLDTDTIYGRFYASIASSILLYVSSLFLPVTVKGSSGEARLIVKNLKGSSAPIVSVHRIRNDEKL